MRKNMIPAKVMYEDVRLNTKDSIEAIYRLRKICTNRETHYIFINDHIGDVIISLGYLNAYRLEKGIKHLTIVIGGKYKELLEHYTDDFNEVIYIPQYDLYRIFLLGLTRFGLKYIQDKYPNVTFINPADSAVLGFEYFSRYPNVHLVEMIKHGCLELDDGALFKPLPEVSKVSKDRNIKKKALISIATRTVAPGQADLYKKIVSELLGMGYEVYTNSENESECITGTSSFYGSLNEIRDCFSEGILIGTRCGLHDLFLYQNCKVVAVYPRNYRYKALFALDSLPDIKAECFEIEQSEDVNSDCEAIIQFIKG